MSTRQNIKNSPHFILVGELLGMEYLYSQTGKTLTPVLQNPEEEDRLVEQVDDQDLQDEGFEEEILEDITVPEPSTSSGGEGQRLAPAPSVDAGGSLSDEARVRHFKGFV